MYRHLQEHSLSPGAAQGYKQEEEGVMAVPLITGNHRPEFATPAAAAQSTIKVEEY